MRESELSPDELNTRAAKAVMEKFFRDKTYYLQKDGKDQPIPDSVLYTDSNVAVVAKCFDYNWGMEFMDEHVKRHIASGQQLRRHPITKKEDEIGLNMFLIKEFQTHAVIKEFQGGIALLYMWLCEGVVFKGKHNETKKSDNEGRARRATSVSA